MSVTRLEGENVALAPLEGGVSVTVTERKSEQPASAEDEKPAGGGNRP